MKKIMGRLVKSVMIGALILTSVSLSDHAVPAQAKKISSVSAAKKAALKKVRSARVVEADVDTENGVQVYDIELHKGNKEYKLEYRASDGKLLEYGWEVMYPSMAGSDKRTISKSQIKRKAKKKVKNASIKSVRLTYDDGIEEYKIKLTKGSKLYELVYNSKTGKLLEYEWKYTKTYKKKATSSAGSSDNGATNSKYIGEAKAKSIALEKAPGATVIKIEFDIDDGKEVYEVEMVKGVYEYDVEIDARTGKILKFEKDIDD